MLQKPLPEWFSKLHLGHFMESLILSLGQKRIAINKEIVKGIVRLREIYFTRMLNFDEQEGKICNLHDKS